MTDAAIQPVETPVYDPTNDDICKPEPAAESVDTSVTEIAEQNQAVDGVAETEAVEQTEAEKAEQAEQAAKQAKEDKTPAWQRREMAIERERRRQAEQRAAELEARLAQLEQGQRQPNQQEQQRQQPQSSAEGAPSMDDPKYNASGQFDALAFMNDLTDWRAEQKVSARFSEWEAKQEQQRQAYEANRAAQIAEAQRAERRQQVESFATEHPDYADVTTPVLEILQVVEESRHPLADIISRDKNAPALVYYLGQNPGEFNQLLDMDAYDALKAIGRIEAKISTPKQADTQTQTPRQSPPKPPPKGVIPLTQIKGGSAVVSLDEKLSRADQSENADDFIEARYEAKGRKVVRR